jgi:hypothetical protein
MRILISVAIAGAIGVATPALAQNNTAPAANAAATNEAGPNNAMTSVPAGPTTPGGETTSLPPTESSPAARGAAPIVAQKTGFPWGVLGLLGLLGFWGRKRSS